MKNYSIFLLAMMVLWIGSAAEAKYSGGTGEPNDPYQIATPEDLNDIGNHEEDWNKYFILINDVNLDGYTGTQFKIIGRWICWNDPNNKPFTGGFDGNEHKVWSFTRVSDNRGSISLFSYLGSSGQIKNLGIENVDINAVNVWSVGGLVGLNNGTITNCYSTGSVSGDRSVGGLVGDNAGVINACYSIGSISGKDVSGGLVGRNDGSITNCYSTGSVSGGDWEAGGLVGLVYGEVTNCYSSSSVTGTYGIGGLAGNSTYGEIKACYSTGSVTGDRNVGGLVGGNSKGAITNCYSTGNVVGDRDIGGLVGGNYCGTISACYSTGSVFGTSNVGGLVGRNDKFTISFCYSTGDVSGNDAVGGLVGYNNFVITNCYSIGSVTGNNIVGGLVGNNAGTINACYSTGSVIGSWNYVGGLAGRNTRQVFDSFWDTETSGQLTSDGGTPKTTAEMKTMSTFTGTGWDFVEVWGIGENQTYPFLLTDPAGDSNHDKKVDFADLAILASHWLEGPP